MFDGLLKRTLYVVNDAYGISHLTVAQCTKVCVRPVNLNDELSPDNSMIKIKNKEFSVNDSLTKDNSIMSSEHRVLEYNRGTGLLADYVTTSTVTCNPTDNDSVANAFLILSKSTM